MKLLSRGIMATIDRNGNRIEIEMNGKDRYECFLMNLNNGGIELESSATILNK